MALGLTYVTGVLSLLFAGALLDQYLTRRQPHHLLWFVAFAIFTMAIGVWFIRETFGLNQWLFRLWYLGAAMLAPAYLGTGMLYLMASRRVANAFMGYLAVVTIAVVAMVLSADLRTPNACLVGGLEVLSRLECIDPSDTLTKMGFFPPWIRVLAGILALYGGLAVVAATGWSIGLLVRNERLRTGEGAAQPVEGEETTARTILRKTGETFKGSYRNSLLGVRLLWQSRDFWRRDIPVQRAFSNLIITLGVMLTGLGLTLNSVDSSAGHMGFFLVSVIIISTGFLLSTEAFETRPHESVRDSIQTIRSGGIGTIQIPQRLRSRSRFGRQTGEGPQQ